MLLYLTVPPRLKVSATLDSGLSICRGQAMKISIPVQGEPFPKVVWTKDGEIIERSSHYEVTQDEHNVTLVAHDVEKSDAGQYAVKVENPLGTDQASFKIMITGIVNHGKGHNKGIIMVPTI